jgi:hypothetical protein
VCLGVIVNPWQWRGFGPLEAAAPWKKINNLVCMAPNDWTNIEMEFFHRANWVLHHDFLGLTRNHWKYSVSVACSAARFGTRYLLNARQTLFCHMSKLLCFKFNQEVSSEGRSQGGKCLDSEGEQTTQERLLEVTLLASENKSSVS